jgi:DNA-binding MarR family transcriptional regulator
VRRDRSAEDRRAVSVSLTERGREALGRQDAWMRGRQRGFFAALPPEEQALAPDLLVRLAGLIGELAAGPYVPRPLADGG